LSKGLSAARFLLRLRRWLGDEPDRRELMRPFPAGPMLMWPISTRVNKPENDDPSIVEPIELSAAYAIHRGS
jgi:putative SOS response-associated peptidase YedK